MLSFCLPKRLSDLTQVGKHAQYVVNIVKHQTTSEILPNSARSTSNGLVKVKLGFVPPKRLGQDETIISQSSSRQVSLSSKPAITFERLEKPPPGEPASGSKPRYLPIGGKSVSRMNSSRRGNFTFTLFSEHSQSPVHQGQRLALVLPRRRP